MVAVGWHEMGHKWAMKKTGMENPRIYFVPFMGGVTHSTSKFKTYWNKFYVSIMGPAWGALMAGASLILYFITGNVLWAAVAGWTAIFNLFNIIPAMPFDGGHITNSIVFSLPDKKRIPIFAVALIISAVAYTKLGLTFFILISIFSLFGEYANIDYLSKYEERQITKKALPHHLLDYEGNVIPKMTSLSKREIIKSTTVYIGLAISLSMIFLYTVYILQVNLKGLISLLEHM